MNFCHLVVILSSQHASRMSMMSVGQLVPGFYDNEPSPLFVEKGMAFDFKPVVKQQIASHAVNPPCLLASTPELEEALLSFSAACSVPNSLVTSAPLSVSAMASSNLGPFGKGSLCSYPGPLAQTAGLFRPESADSPLSTASHSVSPSPLSTGLLSGTNGSQTTAFPFDQAAAPDLSSSKSVHSQSVAAALAGLPLAALQPGMQDQLKKQRKKERNRVAAMKCRKRKLEREADLEEHVRKLKGHNGELTAEVARLRQQVCVLKQTVMKHVNSGCNMVSSEHDLPTLHQSDL